METKELTNSELEQATGGTDYSDRKDYYENIILGVSPEEHNIMLESAANNEVKAICPFCGMKIPISKLEAHKAVCSGK